jgi:hypothetical protein
MNIGDWLSVVSAAGEWAIAFVIYWEWEGSRLDHFLEDTHLDARKTERKQIFSEYCGLDSSAERPRNERFRERIEQTEHENLREICDDNVRLFSRIGARLPLFPPLRNRVLDWHVVVFLWEILGPYVEQRRRAAGPAFAKSFLKYALASVNRLLKQKRNKWVIADPDLTRKHDVDVTRARLVQMQGELRAGLKAE